MGNLVVYTFIEQSANIGTCDRASQHCQLMEWVNIPSQQISISDQLQISSSQHSNGIYLTEELEVLNLLLVD